MDCAVCHTPLPPQSRFCMLCGADLSDPELSTRQRAAVRELAEALHRAVAGRYRVTDMLGRGGMGAVFLAEDLRLGRPVAIKVLRPELDDDPNFLGRFEREARIAARLDHLNIIPIYAVEQTDGLHYFVMKYIAGKSLDELLAGGALPVEQCRRILWQAARGLGHAHLRGVIHRDVKPPNVMVDDEGHVVITDFGISKALLADTQYTSTGQMVGTPRYISPEQAQGLPLDGRSDQYSLAVVGYQALVGRLPIEADTVHALMYKHIYQMPASAHLVRPEVPSDISETIQRALAKRAEDRFPTMEELATALWPERPVRAGRPPPIELVAPAPPALSTPVWRRRPALAAAGVGLVLLVAIGVAVIGVALVRPPATDSATVPESARVDGVPTGSAPSSSAPTDSAPTDSAPTDSAPTDSAPSDSARSDAVDSTIPSPDLVVPEASAASAGFLTLEAEPDGAVSVDGVDIGATPIVRRQLAPGEHVVWISRPGFRAESLLVSITAGDEIRASRSLVRSTP